MVYGSDYNSKNDHVQQGGRFASAEDNKKNKQNTAKKEGKSTYQIRNPDGTISTFNTNKSIPEQNYNAIFQSAIDSGYITESEAAGITKTRKGQGFKSIPEQRAAAQEWRIQNAKDPQYIENQKQNAIENKQKVQSAIQTQKEKLTALQKEQAYWNSPEGKAEAKRAYDGLSRGGKRRYVSPSSTVSKRISTVQKTITGLSSAIPTYDKAIRSADNRTIQTKSPEQHRADLFLRSSQTPSEKGRTDSSVRIGNFYYPKSESKMNVTTPDGKTRTMNYLHGEKFIGRTQNNYKPKPVQGPSNQLHHTVTLTERGKQKEEKFVGAVGSLEYLAGQKNTNTSA